MVQPLVIEGTWEEIKMHEKDLSGRRVRVIVKPSTEQPRQIARMRRGAQTQQKKPTKTLRGYAMLANMPGGSEEFAKEKQAEIDCEDRRRS